ncbi:DUF5752 family protein [Candidatus Acidulodesulfobacterium sp. H_13]|uniref:DUF5752 family protein n=1 Tax=Candidatus Acidulodesulfobacterium sp. H_13 TaxID=3395470 RepID=UPI003AF7D475
MENRANYPFKFYTRLTLPQLTGAYALNLKELLGGIKKSDDPIIYYHTHHYLIQHRYHIPSSPNDFAYWITERLGEDLLGEEISSLDFFNCKTLDEYKDEIIDKITAFMSKNKKTKNVEMGGRFNFMRAIAFVMNTGKEAYTLNGFVDILRHITVFSIYYHFFESHVRLRSTELNDFSLWIKDEIKLPELADKIANLDPYTLTIEKFKEDIIKLTENYI